MHLMNFVGNKSLGLNQNKNLLMKRFPVPFIENSVMVSVLLKN